MNKILSTNKSAIKSRLINYLDPCFTVQRGNISFFSSLGRRRCPGEALAKSAIFLLFIGVMQKYRLLPMPGKKSIKMELNTGLTISLKPYEMLIVPR